MLKVNFSFFFRFISCIFSLKTVRHDKRRWRDVGPQTKEAPNINNKFDRERVFRLLQFYIFTHTHTHIIHSHTTHQTHVCVHSFVDKSSFMCVYCCKSSACSRHFWVANAIHSLNGIHSKRFGFSNLSSFQLKKKIYYLFLVGLFVAPRIRSTDNGVLFVCVCVHVCSQWMWNYFGIISSIIRQIRAPIEFEPPLERTQRVFIY